MRDFSKRKGWLFKLRGGPNDGMEIRLGWLFPNGQRDDIDKYVTFKTGARYKRTQAVWKSTTKTHAKGDLRFDKDGNPYWEFQYVEGSADGR